MLILASASPRRQELLLQAGIAFLVEPANVDETPQPKESARACAERLARQKALAIFQKRPDALVLGADTIVVVDGQTLGKPTDRADAARMLRLLSGRTHEVMTGVCLMGRNPSGSDWEDVRSLVTQVEVTALSDADIQAYIATGEPMDKAGAYAIQGRFSRWIPKIEGDYSNVVGLPVALVCAMLRQHGAA
jgi:septum formation protein